MNIAIQRSRQYVNRAWVSTANRGCYYYTSTRSVGGGCVRPRGFAAAAATESSQELTKTALNELHKELGGDMVPFAGYELPVLYKGTDNGGVMKEHLWCRTEGKASLFDVSHMGQVRLSHALVL